MLLDDREDPRLAARFGRRAVVLGLVQVAALGALGHRLYGIQVAESARFRELAEGNRQSSYRTAPRRGRILDRFGIVLADVRASRRVVIVPHLAGNVAAVLAGLGEHIPLTDDDVERVILTAQRQNPRLPILVAGGLTWEQVARINLLVPDMPGLQTETGYERTYAHGPTAGHLVGYVGAAPLSLLEAEPSLRLAGFRTGRAGIEHGLDARLRGEAGIVRLQLEGRSRRIRRIEETPPVAGRDVVLTVDLATQRRALELIAKERAASLVALDVRTGEIVAMASQPTFDNAALAGAISQRKWWHLRSARNHAMVDRATRGLYPPGSTFKMVTALAGLEAGVITASTKLNCEGSYSFQGLSYGCWKRSGHGSVVLHRAIKESCDCYFYEVARRVGIERLAAMARRLGYGQTYDCGLALQKAGIVPDPAWKLKAKRRPWFPGETILVAIGQGYMLANPLQMAVMTARLASGRNIVPTLVRPEADEPPFQAAALGVSAAHLELVRRGMIGAVNEDGGTAGAAALGGDVAMAGKTGTSQVSRLSRFQSNDSLPWLKRDHGLFVGYAPARNPRYAIAGIVEHGGGGAKSAAPLVRQLMTDLLAKDPVAQPAFVLGGPSDVPSSGPATQLARRG